MTYTVKAVKTFHGHDGYGWECNLYFGKKKVCLVVEDGYGGGLQFHWTDQHLESVDVVAHNLMDQKLVTYKGTPAEAALAEFCTTLPKWSCNDKMIFTDPEIFVDSLVQAKLTEKDVKKLLKKIAIRDGNSIFTYGAPPSRLKDYEPTIKKAHPNAVILNSIPFDKAVEHWKEVAA